MKMPIIGKKDESEPKKREFKWVPRRLVHASFTIPPREQSEEVKRSVKKDGQQQPIISRPCMCKFATEPHFEAIEGSTRLYGIKSDGMVWLDVRYGLTEYEVFKLAHTAHIRKGRNTFEKAVFYARMVETKEKESGGVKKVEVALDCSIDPNLLSQYLKIWQLYKVLNMLKVKGQAKGTVSDSAIKYLSSWGINRLYALTRLLDYHNLLAKAVNKIMATNREFSVDAVRKLVKGLLHGNEKGVTHQPRAIGGYSFALSLSFADEIKDFVYRREDSQIYQKTHSDKEMVKRTALSLAKIGLETVKTNPNDFGEEYDTDKDGRAIFCGFKKIDKQPKENLNALRHEDKENKDKN